MIIDKDLKWNIHIEYATKKLANAAKILCKIRHYFSRETTLNLYYTFAYPPLKYGIIAWGKTTKALLRKLEVMQNKIIRIINLKCLRDRVNMSEFYKATSILQLNDIFKLEMGKFVHSFYHQNLPNNFKNYFSSANTQRSYTTRSLTSKNYFIERVNTKHGQSTCAYIGAKIWNNIPSEMKNMSRYGFNKQFKKQILSNYLLCSLLQVFEECCYVFCAFLSIFVKLLFRFFFLVLYVAPLKNKTQIICQRAARLLMTIKWSFAIQFVAA